MIQSFKGKETESIWNQESVRKLPVEVQRLGLRKLLMLNASTDIADLRVPLPSRPEKLKGDRLGQYSIRVNDQWRICFRWKNGNAFHVEIADYH